MKKFTIKCITISLIATTLYSQEANSIESVIQKNIETNDIYNKVESLAKDLLESNKIAPSDMGSIAISSFVNLDNLSQTNSFGRIVSETMFNELFTKGLNIVDLRSQDKITINGSGEFYISRKIDNSKLEHNYTLVGTYGFIDDKTVTINARIIDNYNKKVVASAKTILVTDNCKLVNNCPKAKEPRVIKIAKQEYNKKNSTSKFQLF